LKVIKLERFGNIKGKQFI